MSTNDPYALTVELVRDPPRSLVDRIRYIGRWSASEFQTVSCEPCHVTRVALEEGSGRLSLDSRIHLPSAAGFQAAATASALTEWPLIRTYEAWLILETEDSQDLINGPECIARVQVA